MSDVVLCCGSLLMGDDGIGLRLLERLREDWEIGPGVELVDGGTWGMNLLPVLEEADRLLIVDAVDAGRCPGSPVVLGRDELPRMLSAKLSPHQIDLREVLALAELRGKLPADTLVLGLQPGSVELRDGPSPEVLRALPLLLEEVVSRLRAWGHSVREGVPCTS